MIVLPESLWNVLLDEFQWPPRALERVAYIDGVVASTKIGVATTLVFPNAKLYERHFDVSADAMSEAGRHFRTYGLQRLAQVHTHPGTSVDHSGYDDRMAYSQHEGAVSIVVPRHAQKRPTILKCGVHVRTTDGWQRIDREQIPLYLRIVPGLLDFRRR